MTTTEPPTRRDASAGGAEITVRVPSLLRDCTGDRTRFPLTAGTLAEAVEVLLTTFPLLRQHIVDEQRRLRPHVLIYFNGDNIAFLDQSEVRLAPGDELTVLQNVSGG
ncbi:MoaD/ThiS family protein [Actinopolymorpha sp. NPDC004070]|uniref:MoaD/ThiS family protein n=1 Tax=Actinopolymorpha sp. NPDC004070 TaxID=3154548 RepID=UPI0033B04E1E